MVIKQDLKKNEMNVITDEFMVIESINFLVENNYADSERAASKIIEAASDEFIEFIYEMTQRQYDQLKSRISNARTPEEKKRLQVQLDQQTQEQRQKVLKPKVKPVIRPFLAKTAKQTLKTKPAKAVGRFLKYTALGGLIP